MTVTSPVRRPYVNPWSQPMIAGVLKLLIIAPICLLAIGCGISQWAQNGLKLGPNYHRPDTEVAGDWLDHDDQRVLPVPPENYDWWSVFQDPVVNDLVDMAVVKNLTLRQAGTRVLQARAMRNITAGNLAPQLQQSFGDYTRVQQSRNIAVPSPIQSFGQWDHGLDVSWELDVWGRFRRAVESADSQLEASVHQYDAILVSLIAEVATAYVDIRTFQQRLEYARKNVEIQESSRQLSQTRFDEGKTSKVGVYLAQANLNGTKATIAGLNVGLRQAENRMCTLLGIPPTDLSDLFEDQQGIPTVPAEIAVGIPADLVRRRPDVLEAENLVAAQSAQIGVAISDLFPIVSIDGEISVAAESFSDLFRSSSVGGFVGPVFRWNILNYGRIVNNVRLQDDRLLELIAAYQDAVLQANQEVEDALVAFLESQQEVVSLLATVDDMENALKLLLIQFEEGSIDFSPIFVLQGSLRQSQDQLATGQGQILLNMIRVYRALGGGWEIEWAQPQSSLVSESIGSDAPVVEQLP